MAAIIRRAWDCVIVRPFQANGATSSTTFSVPLHTSTMTVFIPAAMVTAVSFKIQSLVPNAEDVTEVYVDTSFVAQPTASGAAISVTLGGFSTAAGAAYVFPANIFGGGNIRFTTNAAVGADFQYHVTFTGLYD
jgi:hypothetical protein